MGSESAETDVCWATVNVLPKCADKPDMVDTLTLGAWFPKGYFRFIPHGIGMTWAPRNECLMKNVNSRLSNCSLIAGSFTGPCLPSDDDCEYVSRTVSHCRPLKGFGINVSLGVVPGSKDPTVNFKTNCVFGKYDRPTESSISPLEWFDVGISSLFSDQNVLRTGIPYDNCGGGCSPSDNQKGRLPGFLMRQGELFETTDAREQRERNQQKVVYRKRIRNPSMLTKMETSRSMEALLLLEPNAAATCPAMGKRAPTVDMTACGLSDVAECSYAFDAIAGGCTSRGCVSEGLGSFISTVRELTNPSGQPRTALVRWFESGNVEPADTILEKPQMIARNKAFAVLVEGAMRPEGCGQAGRSCVAMLEPSDCVRISEFASEMQAESGVLYSALKKLSTACFAKA